MNFILQTVLVLAILGLLFSFFLRSKKKNIVVSPIPDDYKAILAEQVPFYQQLDEERKKEFENRVQHFLATTRITGVKTTVVDFDSSQNKQDQAS